MRFPQFSDGYKSTNVGLLTSKVGSGVTPKGGESVYTTSGHPFVRSQNVGNGQMYLDDIAYIDDETHKKQIATEIQEGDVLLNITGASIGRCCVASDEIVGGNVNQHVCIVRPTHDVLSYYLCNLLLSDKGQKQIDSFQAGGNRQGLNFEQIKSFKFSIPQLQEQEKVSELLSIIDERIATQIRIIEDLKSLSDVICQHLYAPTSGDEEWQTYKYAELFSVSNERNSKLQYTNVLSASQEYGMVERNELNIDIKFDSSSIINYKVVRPNEYIIHLRSFQGGFAYSDKTGVCSPAYTVLVPNEKLSTAFLKYYFTSKKFIDSLRIVTYGIRDGRSISVEEFLQLNVAIPNIEHQQHIVQVMQLWEEKIRTEEEYLSKLQQQKQYLLSSMFI